jgi:hypothetical protein|tara:strand:+ start:662 stop:835 length:174 start_codon:yes stop_codon:yes gene_type:complete
MSVKEQLRPKNGPDRYKVWGSAAMKHTTRVRLLNYKCKHGHSSVDAAIIALLDGVDE